MAKVVRALGSLIAGTLKTAGAVAIALVLGAGAWLGARYVAYDEQPVEAIASLVVSLSGGAPADTSAGAAPIATATTQPVRVPAPAGPAVRVLFIGNSLTYYNDMPSMVAGLAATAGINMQYDLHAPGGRRLADHAVDREALAKIDRGTWHFVVIQEQSQWPAFPDWVVQRDMDPPARALRDRIKRANPRATVVLYMTMARRNGDPQNAASIPMPELATFAGMQARINRTYVRLGRELGATVVPVGRAWEAVRRSRPSLNLYSDEIHPNAVGSYLAACVFYATLFRRNPVGLSYTAGLDQATATYLQRVARGVALR